MSGKRCVALAVETAIILVIFSGSCVVLWTDGWVALVYGAALVLGVDAIDAGLIDLEGVVGEVLKTRLPWR